MKLSPSIEAPDYKTNSPRHPLGNVLRTIWRTIWGLCNHMEIGITEWKRNYSPALIKLQVKFKKL